MEKVLALVGSIVVVRALTRCALLHNMCDLKATQINMQHNLIREFIFYKFELSLNIAEAT